MKPEKKLLKVVLLFVLTFSLYSFDLPDGWFAAGSKVENYDISIVKNAGQSGGTTVSIKSIEEKVDGFGTLMQNCFAYNYLGKRIRMSGWLKTEDVTGWAGLWFRVDGVGSNDWLSFDNMQDGLNDRSVIGTTEWTKHYIVLDVPVNASLLAYGVLLYGAGQVWADNLSFEIVDASVPTTGITKEGANLKLNPENLDFEK